MYGLSLSTVTDDQVKDVVDLYASCAPMESARMFGYYLSDWEEGIRMEAEPLPDDTRKSVERAIENSDFETLSAMGFEDPLFFYNVLFALRLATLEQPGKGGGFSCMR